MSVYIYKSKNIVTRRHRSRRKNDIVDHQKTEEAQRDPQINAEKHYVYNLTSTKQKLTQHTSPEAYKPPNYEVEKALNLVKMM